MGIQPRQGQEKNNHQRRVLHTWLGYDAGYHGFKSLAFVVVRHLLWLCSAECGYFCVIVAASATSVVKVRIDVFCYDADKRYSCRRRQHKIPLVDAAADDFFTLAKRSCVGACAFFVGAASIWLTQQAQWRRLVFRNESQWLLSCPSWRRRRPGDDEQLKNSSAVSLRTDVGR